MFCSDYGVLKKDGVLVDCSEVKDAPYFTQINLNQFSEPHKSVLTNLLTEAINPLERSNFVAEMHLAVPHLSVPDTMLAFNSIDGYSFKDGKLKIIKGKSFILDLKDFYISAVSAPQEFDVILLDSGHFLIDISKGSRIIIDDGSGSLISLAKFSLSGTDFWAVAPVAEQEKSFMAHVTYENFLGYRDISLERYDVPRDQINNLILRVTMQEKVFLHTKTKSYELTLQTRTTLCDNNGIVYSLKGTESKPVAKEDAVSVAEDYSSFEATIAFDDDGLEPDEFVEDDIVTDTSINPDFNLERSYDPNFHYATEEDDEDEDDDIFYGEYHEDDIPPDIDLDNPESVYGCDIDADDVESYYFEDNELEDITEIEDDLGDDDL